MRRFIAFVLLITLCFSCGPSRHVVPLRKREQAVSVSLGGPVVKVPGVAILPVPFSSVTYGRGLTNNTTVYGTWFSTAAVFGVAQFDIGVTQSLWRKEGDVMGISATPAINFARDVFEKNSKLWPQLDANFYWKYQKKFFSQDDVVMGRNTDIRNFVYGGFGSWFELSNKRVHDLDQPNRVIPIIQLGHDLRWKRWSFITEIKFIAPFTSNENIVLDYKSLTGNNGATGIYFGLTKRF